MPALPAVPNVLRISMLWNDAADNDVQTILHFLYSGTAPTGATCTNLAQDINVVTNNLAGLFVADVTATGTRVTDLSSSTAGDGLHTNATAGTNTGSVIPANASLLINYGINRRYRGGKPRSYFPFGTQSNMSGADAWSGGFVSTCQADISDWFSAVEGMSEGGCTISQHVNVSYYSGYTVVQVPGKRAKNVATVRATPLVDTITSLTVSPRIASQRRRIPRK